MIRLLVNAGGRTAGSIVSIGDLGDDFAQELLDANQAVPVTPIDPAEPVLEQVGELALQMAAAEARVTTIVVMAESLDEDGRRRVANAVLEVLRESGRNRPAGLIDLLDLSDLDPIERGEGGNGDAGDLDVARRMYETLSGQLDQLRSDLVEEQQRSAALSQELDAAKAAAATHTPPTESGTSGDAAGADAPAVEPAAPETAPAAPPSGAARPRRSRS